MPNSLSVLGIVHTVISVLALIVAFICLFKEGMIDPRSRLGKTYIFLTVITCITGFPIMKTGHFTPGHYLAILLLILLLLAVYAPRLPFIRKSPDYFQLVVMTTTLFLSFVPAINETLTRLPISHPLAGGPDDPIIKNCLMVLLVIFLIGVTVQIFWLRKRKQRGFA